VQAPEETVRLFQYGSNMDRERFIERIEEEYGRHAPSGTPVVATLLGAARLDGWCLRANLWSATQERKKRRERSIGDIRACRVANIVREDGAAVWGALYEIATALVTRCDGERSVVDRLEGHRTTRDPENYAKICVTVDLFGESATAWTYIGLREAIDRCEREHPGTVCDPGYVDTVIAGARSIDVPGEYMKVLDAALGRR
jgi:Gamma-glutamyl cyclotransferase, AIG2-like